MRRKLLLLFGARSCTEELYLYFMEDKNISLQTLRRLPVYLHYLKLIRKDTPSVSATAIAEKFGLNNVQVRKDLAAVSGSGRPKTGYFTDELIVQIENCLGCASQTKAVLIGAGNLGKALISYNGFADYGINVISAFDNSADVFGRNINGKPVLSMDELEAVCLREDIKLGIITVPLSQAQSVCDTLGPYCASPTAYWLKTKTLLRLLPFFPNICIKILTRKEVRR